MTKTIFLLPEEQLSDYLDTPARLAIAVAAQAQLWDQKIGALIVAVKAPPLLQYPFDFLLVNNDDLMLALMVNKLSVSRIEILRMFLFDTTALTPEEIVEEVVKHGRLAPFDNDDETL